MPYEWPAVLGGVSLIIVPCVLFGLIFPVLFVIPSAHAVLAT